MSDSLQETEILKKCLGALGIGCLMARFGFDLPTHTTRDNDGVAIHKQWQIEIFKQLAEEVRLCQTKIPAELQERVALALLEITQWLENRDPKMWGPKEKQLWERWGGIQQALRPYIRQ